MAKTSSLSLEQVAADVGRLLGTTEAHARRWLQQRQHLLKTLQHVRGKATQLISQLNGSERSPRDTGEFLPQPGERPNRKKTRRLSAATRAKMREAAKRRWAARKKAQE